MQKKKKRFGANRGQKLHQRKSATNMLMENVISKNRKKKPAFQSDSRTQILSPVPAVLTRNVRVHVLGIHHVFCAAALPLQFFFVFNLTLIPIHTQF